jgi:hypothetical protein
LHALKRNLPIAVLVRFYVNLHADFRPLLEELLETEEILKDKALMKSIKQSRRDVRAGRVYSIGQLKHKLREEGKV